MKVAANTAVLAVVVGCGSHSKEDSGGLIGQDHPDYPAKKSNAQDVTALTVVIPPTISVRLVNTYIAGMLGGSFASGTACTRVIWGGEPNRKHVVEPVELRGDDDVYRGSIVLDKYLPGRCQWEYLSLRFEVPGDPYAGGQIVQFNERARSDSPNSQQTRRFDLWCAHQPYLVKDIHFERCGRLDTVPGLSRAFANSIPPAERGSDEPLTLTANDRTLLIEFHDLDAIQEAWTSRH